MRADDDIDANRKAWSEAQPKLRQQQVRDLSAAVSRPGYSCLDEIATARLVELGVIASRPV